MRAIIVGAADDFVPFRKEKGDLVIAADAGFDRPGVAESADVAIGDFDSLGRVPECARVVRLQVEKDYTDTYEAARYASEHGCNEMHFYGVLGGKLDHALANLQLGIELAERGVEAVMHGRDCVVRFVADGKLQVSAPVGTRVSVISFGNSRGVTLRGLKYQLEDAELRCDFALGVSNQTIADVAEISVEHGALAVFVYEQESGNIRS